MAFAHVADRHIFEKRRFARACLSDKVHVLAAVIRFDTEFDAATVRGGFPNGDIIQFVKNNKGTLA